MTDILWFKHDVYATSDDKVQILIAECGLAAYGFYWCLVEAMYKAGGSISEMTVNAIAHASHLTKKEKEKYTLRLVEIGLIRCSEKNIFSSARIDEAIKEFQAKQKTLSEHGRRMNSARWETFPSNKKSSCKDPARIPTASCTDPKEEEEREEDIKKHDNKLSCKELSESSLSPDGRNARFTAKETSKTDFFLSLKDGTKANVDGEWLEAKKAVFNGMDVEDELRRMASWLDDNPMKRPMNWKRFAGAWLNRAWDNGRKTLPSARAKNPDYGRIQTSNADWIGQKGGRLEL